MLLASFDLPTVSELNVHELRFVEARRRKQQKSLCYLRLVEKFGCYSKHLLLPCIVEITRVSARKLDSDNLVSSMKAVRDAVALWMNVDDGNGQVFWMYHHKKRLSSVTGVEICLWKMDEYNRCDRITLHPVLGLTRCRKRWNHKDVCDGSLQA